MAPSGLPEPVATYHQQSHGIYHRALSQNLQMPIGEIALLKLHPGGRLNKKDGLTRYGDSHVKDKTSYRPSYL